MLSRAPTQSHADLLGEAVEQGLNDSNQALLELAAQWCPQIRCASQAPFDYFQRTPGGTALRSLAAADFHRQYALCLQALELTVYGYCVYKEFGWERTREAVFSLRRPPIWRRLLSPAPLLALTVSASEEEVGISIDPAQRPGYSNRRNHFFRMNWELQEQLSRIHRELVSARSIKTRIGAWWRRIFPK